jgi:hypothetical protein
MRQVEGRISKFDHIQVWSFKSGRFELQLGNAFKEFLSIDREESASS